MFLGERMSLILLGTFFSFLPLQESKFEKLDGYEFPVYSTDFCPKNEIEWKARSNVLNCTEKNGYTCLPNEHFTELLEFCYRDPHILIEKELCLYLIKSNSLVHGYKCKNFRFGCPTSSYLSTEVYNYPACLLVENGCFYAEQTCKRKINTSERETTKQRDLDKIYPNTTDNSTAIYLHETTVFVQGEIDTIDERKDWFLPITLLALGFLIGILFIVFIIREKKKKNKHNAVNHPLIVDNQDTTIELGGEITKTDELTSNQGLSQSSPNKEATTNNHDIKSKCTRYAVAAIDFGTEYSGYAYSWKEDWNRIRVNESWNSGYFLSSKTPTSILLNPDQSFLAIGYDAEFIYSILDENDFCDDAEQITKEKRNQYYFFQRFKEILYKQDLHLESVVKDITGKEMAALPLVSMLIKHFKTLLLEAMNRSIAVGKVSEANIDFVLTVPANNATRANLFMCEAAKKAGIEPNQLTIVYEEEAVKSYCQHMHLDNPFYVHIQDTLNSILEKGKKYMVVNLGGGCVDIAVLKNAEDDTLEKLSPLTKETLEGISVDDEYEKFMENIGGKGVLKAFAKDNMEDYLIMRRDFETKKRESSCTKVSIRIPQNFDGFLKNKFKEGMKGALHFSDYKGRVTYKKFKLRMSHKEFNKFFEKTIQTTLKCIEEHIKCTDVNVIILVGGLADCKIIQNSLQESLRAYKVVTPNEPGLAVLKGAVYIGHVPNTKQSKVQCITYT